MFSNITSTNNITEPQDWPFVVECNIEAEQSQDAAFACSWTPHEYEMRADNLATIELTLIHFLETFQYTQSFLPHLEFGASEVHDVMGRFDVLHLSARRSI
jgi:hypothetical protein